jgi:uncharacterized protein (TIGR02300 family)
VANARFPRRPAAIGAAYGFGKEVVGMVKAAWGTKRSCQSCGARFYDLNKNPITCPKCGHTHDPEDFVKARRSRSVPAAAAKVPSAGAVAKKPKDVIDGVPIADDELPAVEGDTEDDAALEDTEDLVEDDAELEVEIEDKNTDEET